ncbi:trypsin-like serine protease [Lentzea sp. BCCO 10_0798]|uniref:Trypsin-like serine protease n=1 Tax=Lentzea kristufekii TaxID=3095430 RepID=A0ABU4U3J1_9PSEU|nr:trypsin-like serine protease [Lentzea sp. BCCO 10_0798]MDX8055146.1 trypsin-like serine protease [Lentzea sp. BCCO 10_0798]
MRLTTAIAGAVLAALSLAPATASAAPEDPNMSPMIIGGSYASNFPYAARLFFNGRENCSATKIAPQWILTAEHCVSGSGTYTFRAGSLDQTSGGQLVTANQIIKHPSADLALARVSTSMSAPFAPLGSTVSVGETVKIYGWGATCTNQPEINCQSRYLKVADTRVTTTSGTDYRGGQAISVRRIDGIAAGGDSGGPMFADGRQVGVASTSNRSTVSNYTNINNSGYRAWIRQYAGV